MFSGIVAGTGRIARVDASAGGRLLAIETGAAGRRLRPGDSLSVDGVCLTVTLRSEDVVSVEVSPESLRRTNLGKRAVGDRVNLETPLTIESFLGGHLVQGHVDGVGTVSAIRPEGISRVFSIAAPASVLRHCVPQGSVAVNGVSLTVSALSCSAIDVTIIPHTWEVTTFGQLKSGDEVNLEGDLISKYVEAHLHRRNPDGSREPGFARGGSG